MQGRSKRYQPASTSRKLNRGQSAFSRRVTRFHRSIPGFTIVEIMCAMTLLIVGAFSVFTLIIQSIESNMESSHYSTARAIAQREMEEIRTKVWTSMPTPNNADPINPTPAYTIDGVSSLLPAGVGTYLVTSSQTGLDLVTITITWTEPGRGTDSIILDTYVTENGLNSH